MPSTCVWEGGNAPAVAQVSTITVSGTWATGDTGTITCGSQSVTFTVAGVETIAAVVAGLVAAWNASTAGEMTEVTASDNSPDITLTADTAGVPFTVTTSETTAGDGELGNQSDSTSNSGPYCWDTASNWSGGAVPVTNDTVIFENSSVSCLYGLAQSAVTLTALKIYQSYAGYIGLPRTNANGYAEYRPTYLAVSATSVYDGLGSGAGSGRIKLDTGSNQTDVNIWGTGTSAEATAGVPAFLWKGTHAGNTTTIKKGHVGVAFFGGEAATVTLLNAGYTTDQDDDTDLVIGSGVTLTTLDIDGGEVWLRCNAGSVNVRGGILYKDEAAAISTKLQLDGGTCYERSVGTIASLVINNDGIYDCRQDNRSRTVSSCQIYDGGAIYDPAGTVTWTFKTMECTISGLTLIMPKSRTYTQSAT